MRALPARTVCDRGPTVVTASIPGQAAAVYLRFAAGAADELPGQHGLAHMLEHMLFKGTPTRGIGRAAREIEALGGDLNAWTSHDELVIHAEVAGGAWASVLDVMTDMVHGALLDADELDRERRVILEEIASYEDDPDECVAAAVQAGIWGAHPYGRLVIGLPSTVRGASRDDLAAYRDTHLTADRLTALVVGDVAHEEVVRTVLRLVEGWPRSGGQRPTPPSPDLPHAQVVRPPHAFDDRVVEVGWRGPPTDHPDLPALSVLAAILGGAGGDRITETLDEVPKVGFGGWCDLGVSPWGSTISLGFRPLEGTTVEALGRVLTLVDGFHRSCGGRLCGRARDTLIADLDFQEQTTEGIAEDLLHHESHHGQAGHRATWRAALLAVTPDEVVAAARRWLVRQHAVVGVLDPATPDAPLLAQLTPRPATGASAPGTVWRQRLHGTRLIVAPSNVPVFAARLIVPGGALRVSDRHAGIGAAWARTVHRGAGPYDGEAFHDALDDLAADLNPIEGTSWLGVSVTAPAAHAVDVLKLLGELICDPHFDEEEWSIARTELLDHVRTRLDRPRQVLAERLSALRFAGHPWRLPAGGTQASLQRIGPRALLRWHRTHFVRPGVVLAVTGGVDPQDVVQAVDWLADLPEASPLPPRLATPDLVPGVHTVRGGTRQAVVSLTGRGLPRTARQQRGLELAEALLDGQGGRLFLDLREQRGLAYELWARNEERLDMGAFHVGLATDPSQVEEASQAMRGILRTLADHPPSSEELDHARAVLLGRAALRSQRVESQARRLATEALLGFDPSPEARREALEATQPQDVSDEVARLLDHGLLEVRCVPRDTP